METNFPFSLRLRLPYKASIQSCVFPNKWYLWLRNKPLSPLSYLLLHAFFSPDKKILFGLLWGRISLCNIVYNRSSLSKEFYYLSVFPVRRLSIKLLFFDYVVCSTVIIFLKLCTFYLWIWSILKTSNLLLKFDLKVKLYIA